MTPRWSVKLGLSSDLISLNGWVANSIVLPSLLVPIIIVVHITITTTTDRNTKNILTFDSANLSTASGAISTYSVGDMQLSIDDWDKSIEEPNHKQKPNKAYN